MNDNGDQNDCCGLERDTARGFIILAAMLAALAIGVVLASLLK
jgi:hypothetical protein